MPFTKIVLSPEVFATAEKMARIMTKGNVDKFLAGFITQSMTSLEKVLISNLDIKDLEIQFPSDSDTDQ